MKTLICLFCLMVGVGAAAGKNAPPNRDWAQIYLAFNPSVSPDGTFMVFEWNDRIWLSSTAGGTAFPLGDGTSKDSRPMLAPDGKRVAFLSNRWGSEQLFEAELDVEKKTINKLRQITWHTESLFPWGYTPDGDEVIALAYRDNSSESSSKRLARRPISISMRQRKAEKLLFDAPAFCPSLSPDGSKLLFVWGLEQRGLEYRKRHEWSKTSNSGEIWMYDMASGAFSPVVRSRNNCTSPMWSADAKSFYYLNDADGVRNLYRRSLVTGKESKLTNFTEDHIFGPSLSRDGNTMVFVNGFDLWRLDLSGESPQPKRIELTPALFDPSASRTVRRYYATFDNNGSIGNCTFRNGGKEVAFTAGGDVWVMELSEKKRTPIPVHGSSRTHEKDCGFTPDGTWLYYLSSRGDGVDLWRAKRAETNKLWSANDAFVRERLTFDDSCRQQLSISPDGSRLAWCDATGRLFFADTNGVVRSTAKVDCSGCQSYSWSPNGRYVAAALKDGHNNFDVWIIPTSDDGAQLKPCNISRNWNWDGMPTWSPDGRIIAFSGDRTGTGSTSHIFYAYLDPTDEYVETTGGAIRKEPNRPDFSSLPERVRDTGVRGSRLVFSPDGRTLSFLCGGSISTIKIPDRMKSERLFAKNVKIESWIKHDGKTKVLGSINNRPSIGEQIFDFSAFQTVDVQDHQELAFLSAWADLRDYFYDPGMRGLDWKAIREKYRLAARNAPGWTVFARVMYMLNGELDASHLGFWASDTSKQRWQNRPTNSDWKIFTIHPGVRFDRSHKGEGWLVKDVIPRSPADKGQEGLLPGDVILSVDSKKVHPEMDFTEVMNGSLPHKFRFSIRRKGCKAPIERETDGITFEQARKLLRRADVDSARAAVRKRGNFGYIAIDAMDAENADTFADQVFAECFGKDGLVVDVRFNIGGRTADRLIDMLCGRRHVRFRYRGVEQEGYLLDRYSRPVIADIPVVVLANERSYSNAEEFAHAMKTLKRAKVVGMETAGEVIATINVNLLDYGIMRRPYIGAFLPDGIDMEGNGAKPDIEVDLTPADVAGGVDPQLETALRVLGTEAANRPPKQPLKYAK